MTDSDPTSWAESAEVRLVFAHSVVECLDDLRGRVLASGTARLVSTLYEQLPSLETLIERILSDLAE
jgi:hypothetical protein